MIKPLRRLWRFFFAPPLRFVPTSIRFGLCEKDGWQPVYLYKWDAAENRMNYYACVACGGDYSVSEVTPWGSVVAVVHDLLLPGEKRAAYQAIRQRWAIRAIQRKGDD